MTSLNFTLLHTTDGFKEYEDPHNLGVSSFLPHSMQLTSLLLAWPILVTRVATSSRQRLVETYEHSVLKSFMLEYYRLSREATI